MGEILIPTPPFCCELKSAINKEAERKKKKRKGGNKKEREAGKKEVRRERRREEKKGQLSQPCVCI